MSSSSTRSSQTPRIRRSHHLPCRTSSSGRKADCPSNRQGHRLEISSKGPLPTQPRANQRFRQITNTTRVYQAQSKPERRWTPPCPIPCRGPRAEPLSGPQTIQTTFLIYDSWGPLHHPRDRPGQFFLKFSYPGVIPPLPHKRQTSPRRDS